MNQKLVLTSGVTFVIGMLIILGGAQLTGDKTYFCEERQMVMECKSLSSYYGLSNGKCVNDVVGNKLCKTGWTQDYKIINEIGQSEVIIPSSTRDRLVGTKDGWRGG